MASKLPASRLFTQAFIQAQVKKKNTKAPRRWPLCGEFTGDKWPVTRKMFPLDDVILHWPVYKNMRQDKIQLRLSPSPVAACI